MLCAAWKLCSLAQQWQASVIPKTLNEDESIELSVQNSVKLTKKYLWGIPQTLQLTQLYPQSGTKNYEHTNLLYCVSTAHIVCSL